MSLAPYTALGDLTDAEDDAITSGHPRSPSEC